MSDVNTSSDEYRRYIQRWCHLDRTLEEGKRAAGLGDRRAVDSREAEMGVSVRGNTDPHPLSVPEVWVRHPLQAVAHTLRLQPGHRRVEADDGACLPCSCS